MATKRVLIVDDAMIIRKRIREIAQEAGWQVAGDGNSAGEMVLSAS